jgi:hypothetical protein
MRYLVCLCVFKWYLARYDAKDGVQMAIPISITLQRSILYTLASFGGHYFPHFLSMHMCKLSNPNSSTYVGGSNATNLGLWNLSIFFTHGKILGQATWILKDFIEYLCEKVVINYQKGEIESPSLVLDNWWNLCTNLCHEMWYEQGWCNPSDWARWHSSDGDDHMKWWDGHMWWWSSA